MGGLHHLPGIGIGPDVFNCFARFIFDQAKLEYRDSGILIGQLSQLCGVTGVYAILGNQDMNQYRQTAQ